MKCPHLNVQMMYLGSYNGIPTKNGGHTNFTLFKCECGEIVPFEKENFNLLTEETKQKILSEIRN